MGFIAVSNKGSSAGSAVIAGLPFLCVDLDRSYGPATLWIEQVSFADHPIAIVMRNTTRVELKEITNAGVVSAITNGDFANNSVVMISGSYLTTS